MKESIKYHNYTIDILYDESPHSPREWDNLGEIVCFHPTYRLGDPHNFTGPESFKDFVNQQKNNLVVLPIFAYEHSGLTINTQPFSCFWDSGQVGYIYTTLESLQELGHNWKRWNAKRKKQTIDWLKQEVKIYDDYLTGNVYGYKVLSPTGEEIDACWGYFGDNHEESGLMSDARDSIDNDISSQRTQRYQKVKQYILNHVPLHKRELKLLV